jgi:hypothetical protein
MDQIGLNFIQIDQTILSLGSILSLKSILSCNLFSLALIRNSLCFKKLSLSLENIPYKNNFMLLSTTSAAGKKKVESL